MNMRFAVEYKIQKADFERKNVRDFFDTYESQMKSDYALLIT